MEYLSSVLRFESEYHLLMIVQYDSDLNIQLSLELFHTPGKF